MTHKQRIIETAQDIGFIRGLNFAADIARMTGHYDLAEAIRRQVFERDTISLASGHQLTGSQISTPCATDAAAQSSL
jgi:hypothetical protein